MPAGHSRTDGDLVASVTAFVKEYMSNYDGSHDFNHIQRVLGLSRYIYAHANNKETLDLQVIVLSALLHDVGDKKYLKPGQDASTMVHKLLLSLGADEQLAQKVQTICLGVSYSSEIRNPARVQDLIRSHPELAVVQDADRIDALGAVGIGRCFTFGGTKPDRSMDDSIQHFEDKLVRIQGMMKSETGKELAKQRTERLIQFREWWNDEAAFAAASPSAWE
ncbi:hypothetical protein PG994_011129 [Apiospora phragmitis]|uniref:HD/PDEase domain-containing protein n=1 Tax=Apiospora phragmitis TaxID=2905665 RepID=A0ABR1TUL6_9PEZI